MYKLAGVNKDYPKGREVLHALRGVDIVIEVGEWLAIHGPTGHGKTTLLQMLGGLDRPTTGSILLGGDDLAQLREVEVTRVRAAWIGFIFQTFNLVPTLSAQENVETALVPLQTPPADRRARAGRALADVGLAYRAGHLPSELSGGQQQRVAIARALVKEPKVLLADEPTGNLDEDTRDDIISLLEGLWRDKHLTMVLVTHDTTIARRAERRGVMKHGKLTTGDHAGQAPPSPSSRRLREPAGRPQPEPVCRRGVVPVRGLAGPLHEAGHRGLMKVTIACGNTTAGALRDDDLIIR